ncbi:MAG: nitrogenase component 1 [Methanotrichaceae archaeon]
MASEIKNVDSIEDPSKGCLESPKYSCALGGVLNAANNIYRVVPIIHAGPGCGQNQNFNSYSAGSQGTGYLGGTLTPSSNITEKEVVFGGEGRLREQIESTLELIDGDLFVVMTGCIPSLIGDDTSSVVGDFKKQGYPIISVNSAGFLGSSYYGYELFLEAVIDQLLKPSDGVVKGSVNILGIVPYMDLFWRGDLNEIKRVLELLGLSVNVIFGDFGGVENLRKIPSAELNIVLSPWVGVRIAELLKEKFGTSYVIAPIPSGIRDTSNFLRTISEKLALPQDLVDSVIQNEERETYKYLDLAADMTTTFSSALPFAVISNSANAIKLTRFLANEAGFTPSLVVIDDNPPLEVRDTIIGYFNGLASVIPPKIIFEVDSYKIRQELKKTNFNLLLSSSQERYFAADLKAGHLTASFPTANRMYITRSYAGYRGGITLLEDVLSIFINPY